MTIIKKIERISFSSEEVETIRAIFSRISVMKNGKFWKKNSKGMNTPMKIEAT